MKTELAIASALLLLAFGGLLAPTVRTLYQFVRTLRRGG